VVTTWYVGSIVIAVPLGRSTMDCAMVGLLEAVAVLVPVAPAATTWSATSVPAVGLLLPPIWSYRSVMPAGCVTLISLMWLQIPTSRLPGSVAVSDGATLVAEALFEASIGFAVSTPE
jgi:hypothetical protein